MSAAQRNLIGLVALLAIGLGVFILPTTGHASSGCVSGTLRFHNKNGGYCPASEPCTGANYKQSAFDVLLPIPEAMVLVQRASDGVVIGSSTTDAAGAYTNCWSSPGGGNIVGYISVLYTHRNSRFFVHLYGNTPHTPVGNSTSNQTLVNGTTPGAPQALSWSWGTSASPISGANIYWAAWKAWDLALQNSTRMQAYFTNVDILVFSNTCSTSCSRPWFLNMASPPAYAEQKPTIIIDQSAGTPYNPQERIMHEMGHIADFVAGPNQGILRDTGDCGYDGVCNWNYTTTEWRPKALKEGLASYLASTTLYQEIATDPRACFANGNGVAGSQHCFPGNAITDYSIEDGDFGHCGALEGRWPLNSNRFMWDIADAVNDDGETTNLSLFNIYDSIYATPCPSWPACYGANDAHDPFSFVAADLSSVTNSVGEEDDSSQWYFRDVMLNYYSGAYDVQNPYWANCLGVF